MKAALESKVNEEFDSVKKRYRSNTNSTRNNATISYDPKVTTIAKRKYVKRSTSLFGGIRDAITPKSQMSVEIDPGF